MLVNTNSILCIVTSPPEEGVFIGRVYSKSDNKVFLWRAMSLEHDTLRPLHLMYEQDTLMEIDLSGTVVFEPSGEVLKKYTRLVDQ